MKIYQLKTPWSLWENYKAEKEVNRDTFEATRIATLTSINDFAAFWNDTHIHRLDNYFLTRQDQSVRVTKHILPGEIKAEVTCLSLFRDGIEPKWQSEGNKEGACYTVVFSDSPANVQCVYQNIILKTISQNFPFSEVICGVRFIDKQLNREGKPKIKVDFWVSRRFKERQQSEMSKIGIKQKVSFKEHDSKA